MLSKTLWHSKSLFRNFSFVKLNVDSMKQVRFADDKLADVLKLRRQNLDLDVPLRECATLELTRSLKSVYDQYGIDNTCVSEWVDDFIKSRQHFIETQESEIRDLLEKRQYLLKQLDFVRGNKSLPHDYHWDTVQHEKVTAVTALPDGKIVTASYHGGDAKLWDMTSGTCLRTFNFDGQKPISVVATTNGEIVVSIYQETFFFEGHVLRILHPISYGRSDKLYVAHKTKSIYMAPTLDGDILTIDPKELQKQKIKTFMSIPQFKIDNAITGIAVAPDGSVVTKDRDGQVKIWDLATGRNITILQFNSHVASMSVTSNGSVVASSLDDIKIWDSQTDKYITIPEKSEFTTAIGDRVFSANSKTIKVWNLKTGEFIQELPPHASYIISLTAVGNKLICAHMNGDVRICNVEYTIC